jgi:hypothetical protein
MKLSGLPIYYVAVGLRTQKLFINNRRIFVSIWMQLVWLTKYSVAQTAEAGFQHAT